MLALFAGEIVLKHGDDVFSLGRRQKRGDLSSKLPCCAEQIHAILCEIECFVLIPELLRKFREKIGESSGTISAWKCMKVLRSMRPV